MIISTRYFSFKLAYNLLRMNDYPLCETLVFFFFLDCMFAECGVSKSNSMHLDFVILYFKFVCFQIVALAIFFAK